MYEFERKKDTQNIYEAIFIREEGKGRIAMVMDYPSALQLITEANILEGSIGLLQAAAYDNPYTQEPLKAAIQVFLRDNGKNIPEREDSLEKEDILMKNTRSGILASRSATFSDKSSKLDNFIDLKMHTHLGKVAYQEHIKHCFINIPREGLRTANWEELSPKMQDDWAAVARAVINAHNFAVVSTIPPAKPIQSAIFNTKHTPDTEKSSESTFYLVWNPTGRSNPSFRHKTFDVAHEEARRLAQSNPGQMFYVLKALELSSVTDVTSESLAQD